MGSCLEGRQTRQRCETKSEKLDVRGFIKIPTFDFVETYALTSVASNLN